MSLTADKMRTELANLTEAERADLARFLIQSLDSGSDNDAEAAWGNELTPRRRHQKRPGTRRVSR